MNSMRNPTADPIRIGGQIELEELRARFFSERTRPDFLSAFNETMPLISICVATCDRASLLVNRCITSLLRQSYRNIQIVVVGDHCVDETEYALSRIRDSRISFENLPRRGPYPRNGHARWYVAGTYPMNRALALSEGKFIAHLDDDDEADPRRIERMLEQAVASRAEFLWHKFLAETADGVWRSIGNGELERGQVTTGSIFYHRFFASIPWDVFCFRQQEPGDWNRIKKIKALTPRLKFVDAYLTMHYREQVQTTFNLRADELFLEE